MTENTLAGGPGGGPARAAHPGLALAVIALAQLMIVLDVTIVNVSLPHIQRALGFTGSGLEWVVNAYALAFGGLLLLGGRLGDLLGRRSVFIAGVLLFAGASLAGGLAGSPAWLIVTRALQGTGAAVIAPTALSLLMMTFPEGRPRDKAMGVYAAVSAAGGAAGLLLGGLLVTFGSWRWVFFVNVPASAVLALLARRVFAASARQRGHFDLLGALSGAGGLALLVYGISHAATGQNGVAHWHDTGTVVSLLTAAVLLLSFVLIERHNPHPLVPPRVFASRDRAAAYLIVLCVVTAMYAVFFFLTIFLQTVWGYSPLTAGAAYLPMAVSLIVVATLSSRQIQRFGRRPLLLAGTALVVAGMLWLSRLSAHGSYLTDALGPMLVLAAGLGFTFPANNLMALSDIDDRDAGLASSLLNISQQIGGAIGLAILGTVVWGTVASSLRRQATAMAARHLTTAMRNHALQVGFGHGFEVAALIAAGAIIIAITVIRAPQRRPDR